MRPTDENQAASTRPNLMSSRRSAGEDNILAMLERDSARRNGTRVSSARLAWYGAAAALTGILAGGVAWLAYDNHQTVRELQGPVRRSSRGRARRWRNHRHARAGQPLRVPLPGSPQPMPPPPPPSSSTSVRACAPRRRRW
ncbi:hypothetical protein G4G28_10035 [Massilia sp. Dwa41.01b]|uniref:hypothetical protein n=1 Tax=Massilia sp. Dwa41.01b TaxID=2709302 RepID=UPI001601ECCD|nr:hypothetical protein [Massilia sp. Dwa41.01b]QNA88751.1 hypothetical protein G4G28_10035 [Massilia sp. Dwa41.01b]